MDLNPLIPIIVYAMEKTVASVWGLVALWLADGEILPFDYLSIVC